MVTISWKCMLPEVAVSTAGGFDVSKQIIAH